MTTPFLSLLDGQCIPLTSDILWIGRTPLGRSQGAHIEGDCLYIPHSCLCRQHAVMTRMDDGNYAIADARSRSGTYVNGHQINDKTPLKAGDRIKIGGLWIKCCDGIEVEPEIPNEQFESD